MVKYKTGRWFEAKIDAVEVVKESDHFVTIKEEVFRWDDGPKKFRERREAKSSGYYQYHDTWEIAHAHLMATADEHVQSARLALERAKGAQGNVKGMKKPE